MLCDLKRLGNLEVHVCTRTDCGQQLSFVQFLVDELYVSFCKHVSFRF